jgi:hypothetical protein
MEGVIEAVYVIDSLKSYFLSGDFAGALQFIRGLRWGGCAGLQCLVDEGKLIAASCLGLYDRVLTATDKPPYDADLYYEAILTLYNIESHLATGAQSIPRYAQGLAIFVAQGAFDFVPPASMLRFIEKHGDLLERLDEQRLALSVYIKGLKLAQCLKDQPSEWIFLKCLLRLGAPSQRAEWKNAYHQLIAVCEYSSVRKAEGLAPASAAPGSVYDRLLEVIRDTTLYEFVA